MDRLENGINAQYTSSSLAFESADAFGLQLGSDSEF